MISKDTMTTRYRESLPRLSIPPSLNLQQPITFDGRQPMFSPALPTSLQQSFHPPFPINNSMQTPMQSFFPPHPSAAASARLSHRVQRSIAQLSSNIFPPNAVPTTPLGQGHFSHASLSGLPPFGQQFHPPRNRRQPSIGGPPKAALGGPGRKLSPLPPPSKTPPPATGHKIQKLNVSLPHETIRGETDDAVTHPLWARFPLDPSLVLNEQVVAYPVLTSSESFPPDDWRYHEPTTIDVFLPGKSAWDAIRHQVIEEKLEKLGVERGSGTSMLQVHAPHARAASISSPADPTLLYLKLNTLQQTQTMSSLSSVSSSPRPLFGLPPSPHLQNRHGHTMSFTHPHSLQPPFKGPLVSAVSPSATFVPEQALYRVSPARSPMPTASESIYAPQGRVPLTVSSFAPFPAIRPDSRPDFARGFGLDIPEEEEPQDPLTPDEVDQDREAVDDNRQKGVQDDEANDIHDEEGSLTASQSRCHSRHVSRLSAALSVPFVNITEGDMVPLRNAIPVSEIDDLDQDAAEEWTGSEDMQICGPETSEDESIGDWSNPSDEERARNRRAERRLRRRARETEVPRKLPNFPRPPDNTAALPLGREDDIVSNPSEEERLAVEHARGLHSKPPSTSNEPSFSLSHLPHLHGVSGEHSGHNRSQLHSHATFNSVTHQQQPSLSGRRNSLNPLAKPFVFGTSRESESWTSGKVQATSIFGHSRLPSTGKPLNAAAQEFKPGGFTFRPPPGVPQLTFPTPGTARPLPLPPVGQSLARAQQGREKRQRRGSSASYQGEKSMDSFRFPNPSDVARHSEPASPDADRWSLHESVPLLGSLPLLPPDVASLSDPLVANNASIPQDDRTAKAENSDYILALENPSTVKVKRTPIPLHPTSSNTIPAGVFKALVNAADERTRRSVRSRLSSREIFDLARRPSLDDSNVPPISQKTSRPRVVTDRDSREVSLDLDDVFGPRVKGRSLPSALHSPAGSSESHISSAIDLTGKVEFHRYEHHLKTLLDDKIEVIRRDAARGQSMSPTTKAMITDVVSLFRTQLQESASHVLDDSRMDAHGALDFELIKDILQQGQAESQALLRQELDRLVEQLADIRIPGGLPFDTESFFEQLAGRMVNAVATAIPDRPEHSSWNTSEREKLVSELMSVLTPILASFRSEPVDYDYLTGQLSQAVKPHISQLIDLASDKRETAGLIVDGLLPLLSSRLHAPAFDADVISGQLTSEIRRLIAPIDPFEIKEQVADLVVERLASRLALRDRLFNADTIAGKVNEGVSRLLQPMQHVASTLETLVLGQESSSTQRDDLTSLHQDAVRLLSDLSPKLAATTEALSTQVQLRSGMEASVSLKHEENINHIKSTINSLASNQESLSIRQDEFHSLYKDISNRLSALPETFAAATSALQAAHTDLASFREHSLSELGELRKSNADHQSQLTKARTAHGQARVEKDLLSEKLTDAENDRHQLLAQVKEMQVAAATNAAEALVIRARTSELEEALSQALARLQASDVAAQSTQERIDSLQTLNQEYISEHQNLKSKVGALELQVTVVSRDKQAAEQSLAVLERQYENLSAQQSHWADLCHVSEQMQALTALIAKTDNDEASESKSMRDRYNWLEREHAASQTRFKDQEAELANSKRAAIVARGSLSQAQQRASELESRAKNYESELGLAQTRLDQAQSQLDDMTLQLEERDADYRFTKDREGRLHEKVQSLEAQVTRLQDELEHARKTVITPSWPRYRPGITTNGHSRPDSLIDSRTGTPILETNGRVSIIPSSVWDSMHAPSDRNGASSGYQIPTTPRAHSKFFRPSIPSPTPSNVSLAPTEGEDGWWS